MICEEAVIGLRKNFLYSVSEFFLYRSLLLRHTCPIITSVERPGSQKISGHLIKLDTCTCETSMLSGESEVWRNLETFLFT